MNVTIIAARAVLYRVDGNRGDYTSGLNPAVGLGKDQRFQGSATHVAKFTTQRPLGSRFMKTIHKTLAATVLVAGALGLSQAAQAGSGNCPAGVDLTGNTNYVQFGDAISYSLPILGLNVQSSPGQIGGCIIVTSGPGGVLDNNGGGVTMDNAYNNEQGGTQPYFQTGTANSPDPGGANQFTGDQANTWDIDVQTLLAFLNGGSPIFYFNHNQVNSGAQGTTPSIDQDLFVWAQLTLYDQNHNP